MKVSDEDLDGLVRITANNLDLISKIHLASLVASSH
jgi:hypothetical protein